MGQALSAPWKAQGGPFHHTLPFSTRAPWQMALGPETKVKLGEVPKKGLWLGQTLLRRVSSHFSAQLHLSLQSWKHSLPSAETRPLEAPSLIITFQPEGSPNHDFSQGFEILIYFLFSNCSWLNIGPLSKSDVCRYWIFLLQLLPSTSRHIILKVRLITAGGEFGSSLLFGEKRGK